MTSRKFWGFLDPLPPLVTHFWLIIVLNPRNLPYYVTFLATPSPPLKHDVIYGWSPRELPLSTSTLKRGRVLWKNRFMQTRRGGGVQATLDVHVLCLFELKFWMIRMTRPFQKLWLYNVMQSFVKPGLVTWVTALAYHFCLLCPQYSHNLGWTF